MKFISFSLQSLKLFFQIPIAAVLLSALTTLPVTDNVSVFELRCFSVNSADSLMKETDTGTAV